MGPTILERVRGYALPMALMVAGATCKHLNPLLLDSLLDSLCSFLPNQIPPIPL